MSPVPRPGGRLRLLSVPVVAMGVVLAAALAVGGAGASSLSYQNDVLADSPAGYWRLGEASGTTAADRSPNASAGLYVNGVTLGAAGALQTDPDSAARFDGGNDKVTVADPASGVLDVGTADFTAEAWVKATATDERGIVGKREPTRFWQVTLTDDPNHNGQLRANVNDGAVTRQAYSSRRVDDGAWHHIVVRFARSTGISFYVDGSAAGSGGGPMTGDLSNAAALEIGKLPDYPYFKGDIDEVAVYRSLLSAARIEAHYAASQSDHTAPQVSLTAPAPADSTSDTTPSFTGTAGTVAGDAPTVTVKVYAGGDTSGTPVQTRQGTRLGDASFTVEASPALAPGVYTAQAEQSDQAGNLNESNANSFTVEQGGAPVPASPAVVAAGDSTSCGGTTSGERQTAAIIEGQPDATVLALGDLAYPDGTPAEFANCYDPAWGSFKSRTRPVPGGHDYNTPGAAGYYGYFGAAAGDPDKGYYSYDLGDWHVVALNGECAAVGTCNAGSPQEQWLRADLAAHPASCTLAYVHEPRFSSGQIHGSNTDMAAFWDAFYDHGVELVLSGDDHLYERFLPQTPGGQRDLAHGVAQFVVGTGGFYLYDFGQAEPNSASRLNSTYGVMKLTLHPSSYEWRFLRADGANATDAGSTSCHAPASGQTPPDTTAPQTTITFGPAGTANTGSASFSFWSSEPASTFECRLDAGDWTACSAPQDYSGLADGSHTFQVRGTDAAGNVDSSPAARSWTVFTGPPPDTLPPETTITDGPPGSTIETSASFSFTASESGSTFECRLDGGAWAACSSPSEYTGLALGSHTFDVSAIDAAGNTDPTPAARTWMVDAAPPSYVDAVEQDSPRAWWRLGEAIGLTAFDARGVAQGTYQGGVILGVPGALESDGNTAARFDGGNDQVNAGDPASGSLDFGTQDFTVEAWVKTTANDERGVVSKRFSSAGPPYWQFTVTDDGSKKGRIRVNAFDGGTSREVYGPAVRVDDGAWHHVAVVFDRDVGIIIHVDGTTAVNAGALPGDLSNAGPLLIGKASGYPYFKGDLDEVAVYSGALDSARAVVHYNAGRS